MRHGVHTMKFYSNDLDFDGVWTVPDDWKNSVSADSCAQPSPSRWSRYVDGSPRSAPRLVITRQPEEQHRARYLSEGSRGAIKDRSGTSYCTIQLLGHYRPTRVEIFAGTCSENSTAHEQYQLIGVCGKGAIATPCRKMIADDGIHCLEITLRPETNMTAVLDCVGILKICGNDTRRRASKSAKNNNANCSVRLVFRAYVSFENGSESVIRTESEPIRCVQQLGTPEVLKISRYSASASGGDELFIIGRNFDRNTSVLFREYRNDGTLLWSAEASIIHQYLHQCHLVCILPPYPNVSRGGSATLTVCCGTKSSHPLSFHFAAAEVIDDWRPPSSPDYLRDDKFCIPDERIASDDSELHGIAAKRTRP
ncbi:Nuclear factor of activated T-cells 5 [Toxocara canis]|uniref:Nuclear factor of activated T-cells 5 n=1 Tax=Toxocara canis TaxID=6265 RepID=A0A0B2V0S3_TOXCA|nr:Nuclear factor of activated T-cells 5 [Toxocara canis]